MSGSQGGTTYSRNRNGAYVRQRAVPVNPDSAKQRTVRTNITAISKEWSLLSDAQRSAWSYAAANFPRQDSLGQTYTLTGFQFFMSCNQTLAGATLPIILDCGSPIPVPFPTDIVTSFTGLTANCTAGDTPVGYTVVFEATPFVSAGRTSGSVKNLFKRVSQIVEDTTI
jgi:hypothetical protein